MRKKKDKNLFKKGEQNRTENFGKENKVGQKKFEKGDKVGQKSLKKRTR